MPEHLNQCFSWDDPELGWFSAAGRAGTAQGMAKTRQYGGSEHADAPYFGGISGYFFSETGIFSIRVLEPIAEQGKQKKRVDFSFRRLALIAVWR